MILDIVLTEEQSIDLLTGGIIGGTLEFILGFAALFYILVVIASWRIFQKAGIAGWKSLIPLYNFYLLCKIADSKLYFWVAIIAAFLQGALLAIFESNDMAANISTIVTDFAIIYADVVVSLNLAKAFGKSRAFGIGLLFFPNVFQLILGFGKAEYQKID